MSSFNSPSSFQEEELVFKNVPTEVMDPYTFVKDYRKHLQESLILKEEAFNSLMLEAEPRILTIGDQIKRVFEEVESLKAKKNVLSMNLMKAKHSITELEHKKRNNLKDDYEVISQEELKEMLQKVVTMEKENELKISELKKTAKTLVGQMCYYKEYLDVYVDVPENEYYIFYFRRCSGQDSKRPDEWIKVKTDNFKEFYYVDASLPDNTKEKQDLRDRFNDGVSLRELVILARKYCLNLSKA